MRSVLSAFRSKWKLRRLLSQLRHPEQEVRLATIRGLGGLAHAQSVQPLLSHLAKPSLYLIEREAVLAALDAIDRTWHTAPSAYSALLPFLAELHGHARLRVAETIGRMGIVSAIPHLIVLLADRDVQMRATAAEVLRAIDPDWPKNQFAAEGISGLVRAMGSCDDQIQDAAEAALNRIDPKWHDHPPARLAVPFLVDAVKHSPHYYEYNAKRTVETLASIASSCPNTETAASVIAALSDELSRTHEPVKREHIVQVLTRLGAADALSHSIGYHFEKRNWRRLAELGKLGSPATQYLIDVIDGRNESQATREAAVEGLVVIGAAAQAALLSFLATSVAREFGYGESLARRAAAEALNRINPSWRQEAFAGQMFREIINALRRHKVGYDTIKAAQALGDIADISSVEAVQALISAVADQRYYTYGLSSDITSIGEAEVAATALTKITGESFGADHASWVKWWQTHQPGRAES